MPHSPSFPIRSFHLPLLVGLLLAVAGCSDPGAGVDPQVYAQDTVRETLQRYLHPRAYWAAKVSGLEQVVSASRREFAAAHAEYRAILQRRREAMLVAVAAAKAAGGDPVAAKKEVVLEFRTAKSEIRKRNHLIQKRLRQELQLLEQARRAQLAARY